MRGIRRFGAALADAEAALRLDGEDLRAREERALALSGLGDHQRAAAAWEEVLRLAPGRPVALVNQGAAFLDAGEYEQALEVLNAALALEADDPTALVNLAAAMDGLKRHDEAIQVLSRAIELRPDDPGSWYNRAASYSRIDRMDEARADLARALELDPSHEPSVRWTAELALDDGDRDAARDSFAVLVASEVADPTILVALGRLEAQDGNPSQALAWWKAALGRDSSLANDVASLDELAALLDDPIHGEGAARLSCVGSLEGD